MIMITLYDFVKFLPSLIYQFKQGEIGQDGAQGMPGERVRFLVVELAYLDYCHYR